MRLNAPQYKQQSRSDGYLSRRFDDDDYDVRRRGYYMTSIDTEFCFECQKKCHEWAWQTSEYFSTQEEKFCISKLTSNVLFIIINTNEITSHFTFAACFFNSFSNICGRSTHLWNNPCVYYYFSAKKYLAVSLSNLKTLIKYSFLLYSFMNY